MPRSNGIALALGGLSVAIASTGTAVAVTASTVQIADPTTPSHVAHVDANGRLSTSLDNNPVVRVAAPNQPLTANGFLNSGSFNALMGPTTATIAITRAAVTNSASNAGTAYADFNATLAKVTVGTSGSCYEASASGSSVEWFTSTPGSNASATYPTPLVFKPTGGKAYCIGYYLNSESAGGFQPFAEPNAMVSGFLVAGSFSTPFVAAPGATAPRATKP